MADTEPTIRFADRHEPPLASGNYKIEVTQQITAGGDRSFPTTLRHFAVFGERFALDPGEVVAVFPPKGSLGEYSAVLPHVILRRSTLPWERKAKTSDKAPWLALLVFHEHELDVIEKSAFTASLKKAVPGINAQRTQSIWSELVTKSWLATKGGSCATVQPEGVRQVLNGETKTNQSQIETVLKEILQPQTMPLKKLRGGSNSGEIRWAKINEEIHDHDDDPVTVINVRKSLLQKILPTLTESGYLTHVRETDDGNPKTNKQETAVVIANRLPKANGTSIVHLVSLEGCFVRDGIDLSRLASDRTDYVIRLATLHTWQFSSITPERTFAGLVKNLNKAEPTKPPSLRLPDVGDTDADKYLKTGAVPLRHTIRDGARTVSWYRGPLVPNVTTDAQFKKLTKNLFPVSTADALLRYDDQIGMFDVSYAAAWELGRLMSLDSKAFSVDLYHWKRAHSQQLHQIEQYECQPHQPFQYQPPGSLRFSKPLEKWLSDLSLLRHVPFNYLVPDPDMLPSESIRFFAVDPLWIAALVDGAFSVGRVTATDYRGDKLQRDTMDRLQVREVTGFLLRSAVVAGWPDLQVNAWNQKPPQGNKTASLPERASLGAPLRQDRLSPNVLFCLFANDAQTIDIHQKPETLHFGFDPAGNELKKPFRKPDGKPSSKAPITVHFRKPDGTRAAARTPITDRRQSASVIDVKWLFDAIRDNTTSAQPSPTTFKRSDFSAAQFALEMIEEVPNIRFLRS